VGAALCRDNANARSKNIESQRDSVRERLGELAKNLIAARECLVKAGMFPAAASTREMAGRCIEFFADMRSSNRINDPRKCKGPQQGGARLGR